MSITLIPRAVVLLVILLSIATARAQTGVCPGTIHKDFDNASFPSRNLNGEALHKLNELIDAAGYDVRSLLVLHQCKLIFERYKVGVTREQTHALYSVSKQLTALSIAAAIEQKKLPGIEEPLSKLIKRPVLLRDAHWEKLDAITLKHVLTLRSGIDTVNGKPEINNSVDMLREGLALPMAAKPGEKFNYTDYDYTLAGLALSNSLGHKDLRESVQTLVAGPLDMLRLDWEANDKAGVFSGGFGAKIRPMDMLKLGQVMLQNGQWNGKQLLWQTMVTQMRGHDKVPERGGWDLGWIIGKNPDVGNEPFFFASGRKGQRIYVFPRQQLVVALTSALSQDNEALLAPAVVKHIAEMTKSPTQDEQTSAKLLDLQKVGFNGTKTFAQWHDAIR